MPIWITLTPEDIAEGEKAGSERHELRRRQGAQHQNNLERDDARDLPRDKRSATVEYAAHLALGTRYWDRFSRRTLGPKQADLDFFIDVKDRTLDRFKLIIPLKADPNWVYLSVCSELWPTFCIKSWCWGKEGMLERFNQDPVGDRTGVPRRAYFVDPKDMSVMHDAPALIPIIRERWKSEKIWQGWQELNPRGPSFGDWRSTTELHP